MSTAPHSKSATGDVLEQPSVVETLTEGKQAQRGVDLDVVREAASLRRKLEGLGIRNPDFSVAPALGGELTRIHQVGTPAKTTTAFRVPPGLHEKD